MRAIYHTPEGGLRSVKLPAGAVLTECVVQNLFGMIGVYWERRHYSVPRRDLFKKAERVSTA
jgi:hypothetical protein